MSEETKTDVGIAGFNVLERCGIVRWGREFFPHIRVHDVRSVQECNAMTGLTLSLQRYEQWRNDLLSQLPTLVLTEQSPAVRFTCSQVRVVVTTGDAKSVEMGIRDWLLSLGDSVPPVSRRHRFLFSDRERGILQLLHDGASNSEIALALGIKVPTVKTYLRRIYERVGASNRTHAVALYKEMERF